MTEEEQQALLDAITDQDAPWWLEEGDPDPQDDPPREDYDLAELAAQCPQARATRPRDRPRVRFRPGSLGGST